MKFFLPLTIPSVDLEVVMLSEISQRKHVFTCMWNLKDKTTEQI